MGLEDLEKDLYREGEALDRRPEGPEEFRPGRESEKQEAEQWQKEEQVLPKQSPLLSFLKNKKNRRYLIAGAAALALLSVALFLWGFYSFDEDRLELKLYGPERIVSGETVNYVVQYKNNNRVDLEDVRLTFFFPEGAVFEGNLGGQNFFTEKKIGSLKAGEQGQQEFKVQLTGVKNETREARTVISYHPSTISSLYQNEESLKTEIISVPLSLNFSLPEKVVSGQKINLVIQYLNDSNIAFEDLKLLLKYPNGFIFEEALPAPSEEKNIWNFEELSGQETGEIKIQGVLSGEGGEVKAFEAVLGIEKNNLFTELARVLKSSQVDQAPLTVSQTVNGSESYTAQWGERLNYQISYKNTSRENIRGVTVKVKIDPQALDLKTLNITNGTFDNRANTISWSNEGVSNLGYLLEGQSGTLSFSVGIQSQPPVKNFSDKNFTIKAEAGIDSPNIPLSLQGTRIGSESVIETRVNSLLSLNASAYFQDDSFSNSGPIPPRVGQTTTFSVYWNLTNSSSDLKNVKVEAFLPGNVAWTGNLLPRGEDISFDPSTRKITWKISELRAGIGYILPARQVVFQVALTPSVVQVGKEAPILQQSSASALDSFTGSQVSSQSGILTTNLTNDPSVGSGNGRVQD